MNKLDEYRSKIDEIDKSIIELFELRLQAAAGIASVKKETGKAIYDASREESKLIKTANLTKNQDNTEYTTALIKDIMDICKNYQRNIMEKSSK